MEKWLPWPHGGQWCRVRLLAWCWRFTLGLGTGQHCPTPLFGARGRAEQALSGLPMMHNVGAQLIDWMGSEGLCQVRERGWWGLHGVSKGKGRVLPLGLNNPVQRYVLEGSLAEKAPGGLMDVMLNMSHQHALMAKNANSLLSDIAGNSREVVLPP